MNNLERQKWTRFLLVIILILIFFGRLLPLLIILLIIYTLYKRTKRQSIIPSEYERHVPEEIINLTNKIATSKKYTSQNMETINPKKFKKAKKWVIPVIILLLILPFIGTFFVIVDAGETGVRSLFGRVYDREFSSGFHLKNPFERVTKMNIRTQEYTMSIAQGEGRRFGDDSISALTEEGLQVDLDITVLFHLVEDTASDVYKNLGVSYEDVILRPQARSVIREVIAQYQAKDIYSEKREEAASRILDVLEEALEPRGIEVENVLLRNVQLPDKLADSIQQKLQAEQDAERYDFVLDRERKEAERKRVEAEGQRDAQQIINQSLTSRYLQFLYIESLKDREGTIYVPTDPNNGVPLFRGL